MEEIIEQASELECLHSIKGKPNKLKIYENYLYWLQKIPSTLCRIPLDVVKASEDVDVWALYGEVIITSKNKELTKEEELSQQRTRNLYQSITSYHIVTTDTIFYTCGASLYLYYKTHTYSLFDYLNSDSIKLDGVPFNFQHSPGNPFHIAFTMDNNIYLLYVCIKNKPVCWITQITSFGKGKISCGVAEYMMQEEFDRYTGYWWSPCGTKILFTVTDSTSEQQVSLCTANNDIETMSYCPVNGKNAVSALAYCNIPLRSYNKNEELDMTNKEIYILSQYTIQNLFNTKSEKIYIEYLPRIGWIDSQTIFIQGLNRLQDTSILVSIPIENFIILNTTKETDYQQVLFTNEMNYKLATQATKIWSDYRPDAWIDCTQQPIASSDGKHLFFIARTPLSTTPGYQQVYCWSSTTKCVIQLTHFDHNVIDNSLVLDDEHRYLSFTVSGLVKPLQNSVVFMTLPSLITTACSMSSYTITPEDKCSENYVISMVNESSLYIASSLHSDENIPLLMISLTSICKLVTEVEYVKSIDTNWFSGLSLFNSLPKGELISYKTRDGIDLHLRIAFPCNTSDTAKIPIVLYVYGGPHAQLLTSSNYHLRCSVLIAMLLGLNIGVAVVDNRMAHHAHGQNVHSGCKYAMGTFEVNDYVDALGAIAHKYGSKVNVTRAGVTGWSYGGYTTLLAMCGGNVFKAGVAGAPIGNWLQYDAGYTERYMGCTDRTLLKYYTDEAAASICEKSNQGYRRSSIESFATEFPSTPGKLLLAHGLQDENVHFAHMNHILMALNNSMKPYQLLLYPGERHAMKKKAMEHFHINTAHYFKEKL